MKNKKKKPQKIKKKITKKTRKILKKPPLLPVNSLPISTDIGNLQVM